MRQVVLYELLALDGVAEDPDRFTVDWDEAMEANLAKVISSQDAVILGRRSYEEWAAFWPDSKIEPFATFINGVHKYVATSSPLRSDWARATAIHGDLVSFVQAMKETSGGDIGIHASISVARALLTASVVDEVHLVIAPAAAGSGRRLLDDLRPLRFETIAAVKSPTGYLLASYRLGR